ncbi:hypothetical protein [Xanthomonas phage RTH11]|nr:hypothetical protein [Xanthomonas phage RTH11]
MFSSLQVMYLKQVAKKYAAVLLGVALIFIAWSNHFVYGEKGLIGAAALLIVLCCFQYEALRSDWAEKRRLKNELNELRTDHTKLSREFDELHTDYVSQTADLEREQRLHEAARTGYRAALDSANLFLPRIVDLRRQRLLLLTLLVRAFPSGIRAETFIQEWEVDRSVGISATAPPVKEPKKTSDYFEQSNLVPYLYITLPNGEQMRIPLNEEEVRQLRSLPDPVGDYTGVRNVLLETLSFDNFAKLLETHPEVQLALMIKVHERESAA